MLKYFKKIGFKWSFLAMSSLASPILLAQSLHEAVQYGLIFNTKFIFSSTNELANGLPQLQKTTAERQWQDSFNGLTLKPKENVPSKITDPTNDLVFKVVDHYLLVFFQEKRLELAKSNLRLHRVLFLENSMDKFISGRLSKAEAQVLKAQAALQEAQKQYARIIGKWPNKLSLPEAPENQALPLSLGQAIEQGLDNYLFFLSARDEAMELDLHDSKLSSYGHKGPKHLLKTRSMLELSKSIRTAWEDWTAAGLQINALKRELAALLIERDALQIAFQQGKASAEALLNRQAKLFKAQIAHNQWEFKELTARYHVLKSTGSLMAFINDPKSANAAAHNASLEVEKALLPEMPALGGAGASPVIASALAALPSATMATPSALSASILADLDQLASPYPDYKPQFDPYLVAPMPMGNALKNSLNKSEEKLNALSSQAYLFAGTFKNKANAVALVARLKGLGFMAFLKTEAKGSSVFIGPYAYRSQAKIGMKRLKEIAHVQGTLLASL